MTNKNELIRVFTGSEVSVILLKGELEEIGVGSIVQNDYISGISAGFLGGTPTSVDLFIEESDFILAKPLIDEFIQNNN